MASYLSSCCCFAVHYFISRTDRSLFLNQPERISGHAYSIRSDVWSTGLSLLELVQNQFPFPSDLPAIELMMYISASEVIICWS